METAVGGLIHGISLPSFLQMAEMERANFTLRITAGERSGYLYLKDGVLIAAQLEERKGHEAAYRIISWDGISIEILPAEESRTVEIKQPLMHVLMESLKIKDEITSSIEGAPDGEAPRPKKHSKYSQRLVRLERAPSPRAPSKKVRPLAVLIAVISIVTICGVGLLAYLHFEDRQKSADGYQDLLRQIERIEGAELKMIHLQEYLAANAKTPNRRLIEAQIAKLRLEAEDQDFEKTTLQISSHEVNELYEQRAISMYSTFLEKYPNSRYTERINKAISDIKELLDQYYYEELKRAAQLDFKARLKTYREYVARFPTGRFRNDVETLIIEMGRQYLSYLKTEMEHCQKNQRWDNCISRSEGFADAYTGTPLESEANKFKAEVSDRRDLGQLRKTVELLGTDYQKAYETYKAYLTEHPQSTQKTILLEEMGQLDKKAVSQRKWLAVLSFASETNNGLPERIQRVDAYLRNNSGSPYISEAQDIMTRLEAERRASLRQRQTETKKQEEIARLQKEKAQQEQRQKLVQKLRMDMERQLSGSSRYRSNGDGTVTDLKTNLTWGLLDANQELGGCLNYPNAHNYVRGLSLGGYTDWRMPTANELAAIYKQTPYFPTSGTEWYWSSESYAKGYHTVADIVTSEPKSVFERAHRELNQCGGVRAVRP
jgi:outer membrane protein assembly factor BamD (BamD/ComL family)